MLASKQLLIALGLAYLACPASGFLAGPALLLRSGAKLSTSSAVPAARYARSGRSTLFASPMMASTDEYKAQLSGARQALVELFDKTNANPIMVRLAWHDSGTYDVNIKEYPKAGGAIGSIRFSPEITHGANKGLSTAVTMLEPIKKKFPLISYADLYQLASATAIEVAGGPKIPMRYGRVDAKGPEECSPEGNLPDAEPSPAGTYGTDKGTKSTVDTTPAGHLRKVFYRMGLGDKEIVALSGAHTLGRAWKDRSGLGKESTKFTQPTHVARADGKAGIGKAGGQPWTEKWLKFDNSYFTTIPDANADPELLKLSTDRILFNDAGFKPFAEKYKASQADFFADYAEAHAKLSELGSKFEPKEGIKL